MSKMAIQDGLLQLEFFEQLRYRGTPIPLTSFLNPGGPDFLSHLLPELLSKIWFYLPPKRCRDPICKALLPYDQLIQYHEIIIFNKDALHRLVKLFERKPVLATLCRSLSISDGLVAKMNTAKAIRNMTTLFELLQKVKEVKIYVCLTATLLLLKKSSCEMYFPKMKSLKITLHSSEEISNEPDCVFLMRYLGLYPSLRELELTLEEREPPNISLPKDIPPIIIPNITKLEIGGRIVPHDLNRFAEAMSSLVCLTLGPSDALGLAATVKACPASLHFLEIDVDQGDLEYDYSNEHLEDSSQLIDNSITHLKNLEELVLCPNYFTRNLFRHLKDLPLLKSLKFSSGDFPTLNLIDLHMILDPTSSFYCSFLRELKLSVLTGSMGKGKDGKWELPDWIEGQIDYEGVKDIVELGQKTGVKVCGRTVDALKVQDAYDEERIKLGKKVKGVKSGKKKKVKATAA